MAFWAVIFVGVPLFVAGFSGPFSRVPHLARSHLGHGLAVGDPTRANVLPRVEPLEVLRIAPVEARAINAAIPFSGAPNSAARPFRFSGEADSRARAMDCLAAAQYYEAGDDPSGQEAVAQVIINRMRHPAFPKTICGVVFQGSERTTGCQFTFTCDGALNRRPTPAAWERARALAADMLSGRVDSRVGLATHYHTNWVVPYWSSSLDKITSVDTHLFFRWKGWWGTSGAFRGVQQGAEPAITRLSFLSPMHASLSAPYLATDTVGMLPEFAGQPQPAIAIGENRIGDRFGPARLSAVTSLGDGFAMVMEPGTQPDAFEALARQMCAGRTNCRVMGWSQGNPAPARFPINDAMLATMSYSYIRAATYGLERTLYNCKKFPKLPRHRCMQERMPGDRPSPAVTPQPSASQPTSAQPSPAAPTLPTRTGTETLRLTP